MGIAKVQTMRSKELLPKKLREIPNLNEIDWKYEIPDWPNTATKDQSMPSEHNDTLILQTIDFLLDKNLTKSANDLL